MATDPQPAAGFTPLEHAVMRHAIQDWAAQYQATIGTPARYITEGHLSELVARHGTQAVWDAVADYIRRNPRVLQLPFYGDEGRDARQQARANAAAQLMTDARLAFERGALDVALHLVDQAELTDATYQVRPGWDYDYIRDAMRRKAGQR